MLHDAAITAFGHLVEESLHYVAAPFDHEMKLSMLLQNPSDGELGGINLQIYEGYQSGIRTWAERAFGPEAEDRLGAITAALAGKGKFGRCITGDVDLDNLDNLTRIAFHMGLDVDRYLPVQIAKGIVESNEIDGAIFSSNSIELIKKWLELRRKVYNRLMLSRDDFTGKVMLIYATVTAYVSGDLGPPTYAWTLTDNKLIQHLLLSKDADVAQTVRSWLVHDLWPLSDLLWMQGEAPDYAKIYAFSKVATTVVGRPCFAYCIRDKRVRLLKIRLETGETVQLGTDPDMWVLGVASRKRVSFDVADNRRLQQAASEFFGTKCLGKADEPTTETLTLFQ
jgi:HD superfamily phosphohydrolase